MFSKILGRAKNADNPSEIATKISKMSLSDMISYIKGKTDDTKVDEEGVTAVMTRLLSKDENSNYYIKPDDMDSKLKKAFELVILISKNKKITVRAVELIQEFTITYEEIIKKYDYDHKQIYGSRLSDALSNSAQLVNDIADINNKMAVIK